MDKFNLNKIKLERKAKAYAIYKTIFNMSKEGGLELFKDLSFNEIYSKWLKEEELRSDKEIIKLEVKHGRLHKH